MKKVYSSPVVELLEYESEVLSTSGFGSIIEDEWDENNQLI